MLIHPRWKACYKIVIVPPRHVYVEGEEVVELQGKTYVHLAPHLMTGRFSIEELLDMLEDVVAPINVINALSQLVEDRYIEEADDVVIVKEASSHYTDSIQHPDPCQKYYGACDLSQCDVPPFSSSMITKWPLYSYTRAHLDDAKPQAFDKALEDRYYAEALVYAEKNLLHRMIRDASPDDIVDMLCSINRVVLQVMPQWAGKFRFCPYVAPTNGRHDEVLAAKEWEEIKKVAYVSPHPHEIYFALLEFARELQALYRGKVPLMAIAAFVHEKLVEIHPFINGNGRTARIFMNMVLMQSGYLPVTMDDDSVRPSKRGFGIEAIEKRHLAKVLQYLVQAYGK